MPLTTTRLFHHYIKATATYFEQFGLFQVSEVTAMHFNKEALFTKEAESNSGP